MRKKFISKAFFILLLILNGREGISQAVTGIVLDKSSKQPVEFATVQLLHTPGSSVLKTTVTAHKEKFLVDNVSPGNYILRFSFIGYSKIVMPLTVDQQKEHIGIVEIATISKDMNGVVVTGRRSLLCMSSKQSELSLREGFLI